MSVKRVVVDTNVVVSGLIAGGNPQKILKAWINGKFIALMSSALRTEINLVLNRPKFIPPLDQKRRIVLGTLFNRTLFVLPKRINKTVFDDEKDHFLYELAVTGQASYIVTGDQLLFKKKTISNIEILNPEQFCKKLRIRN